jgi:hypothetical protein
MKLSLGITPRDYSVANGINYDADALAYFNANTAITSAADKNAINTFYLGLKTDGVYSKINAMYLPIWGSAATCKWNLVNPLDTDASFRLTFSTGWTFQNNGMLPNGTSAFADTFYIPSVNGLLNSSHLSFYSQTDINTNQIDIGCQTISNYYILQLRVSNIFYALINQSGLSSTANTNSTGFYIGNRQASNNIDLFKNGTRTDTTTVSGLRPTNKIYIGANNTGTPGTYSSKRNCFVSIGNSLTDTEATNFSNRVNTLMTYFGINTY